MGNMLVNTRDQKFILFEQIGIEKLFASDKYAHFSTDLVEMMLKEAEKLAVEVIAPTYQKSDKEDPAVFQDGKAHAPKCFHDPYKKYVEGGWLCPPAPEEVGGQGMPTVVFTACNEMLGSANYAFFMYPGLTLGAAALIGTFGAEAQLKKYAVKMFSGEWSGTMCLTEPGAGSDVGALKTTAKRLPDGMFSISGTKIFISAGDHDLTEQIVHPVLARIEGDPPGTKGISIFIVPKYRVNEDGSLGDLNDITTVSLEHKMGIKGSATATLNFGENGNCVGELLGNEREGMRIMFKMMNEARLSTGMQGLGFASTAYEHAVQYAKERIQFRRVEDMGDQAAPGVEIINHPDIRRSLLWMKSHIEGMRSLNYYVAYLIDREQVEENDEEKVNLEDMIGLLTPIIKAYCSDKGFEICNLAVDIYGGYGYCSDYPMEQYLRDSKIATIYEGTNYIQSLDLVGRKMGRKAGATMMALLGQISTAIQEVKETEALTPGAEQLEGAHQAVSELVMQLGSWAMSGEIILPVLNARPFLMIMGDLAVGWQLMQAAKIALEKLSGLADDSPDYAFYQGKVASAKYFSANILPTIKGRCEAIKLADKTPVEIPEKCFESQ